MSGAIYDVDQSAASLVNGFLQVPKVINRDKEISVGERYLWAVMLQFANISKTNPNLNHVASFASNKTLAEECNVSVRTVISWKANLERRGWIRTQERPGTSDLVFICIPPEDQGGVQNLHRGYAEFAHELEESNKKNNITYTPEAEEMAEDNAVEDEEEREFPDFEGIPFIPPQAEKKKTRVDEWTPVRIEPVWNTFEAICLAFDQHPDDVARDHPAWMKQQLAIAKRIVARGHGPGDTLACIKWLKTEPWVKGDKFGLQLVDKMIDDWSWRGKPGPKKTNSLPDHDIRVTNSGLSGKAVL